MINGLWDAYFSMRGGSDGIVYPRISIETAEMASWGGWDSGGHWERHSSAGPVLGFGSNG